MEQEQKPKTVGTEAGRAITALEAGVASLSLDPAERERLYAVLADSLKNYVRHTYKRAVHNANCPAT